MTTTPDAETRPAEKPFWVSWYQHPGYSPFELNAPWWVSGMRMEDGAETICAAVMATDEEAAREAVLASFDHRPEGVVWRFTTEQAEGWSPFCDRFERAAWMPWPASGAK